MKVVERKFTNGMVEVEVVSDHGQPVARLDVKPRTLIGDDDGLDHFDIRYSLRAKNETDVVFLSTDKPDTASVPRNEP